MVPLGELTDEDKEEAWAEYRAIETYDFMKASQWMNVPPWELLDKPPWWIEIANECRKAENAAERAALKRKGGK